MEDVKPCLWCRIFGHKWHDFKRVEVDRMSCQELILFAHCTRCGTKGPDYTDAYGCQQISETANKKGGE